MTEKQVAKIRAAINAAWDKGDKAEADRLQSILHDHFVSESDAFLGSAEGSAWMDKMIDKP